MAKIPSGHVKALNTISGQVSVLPEKFLNHPVFGKNLVAVDDDQKSYVPELFKPTTPEEFTGRRRKKNTESEESEKEPEVTTEDSIPEVSE